MRVTAQSRAMPNVLNAGNGVKQLICFGVRPSGNDKRWPPSVSLDVPGERADVIFGIPCPLTAALPRKTIHPNGNPQLKPYFNGVNFGPVVLKVVRNCQIALGSKH